MGIIIIVAVVIIEEISSFFFLALMWCNYTHLQLISRITLISSQTFSHHYFRHTEAAAQTSDVCDRAAAVMW